MIADVAVEALRDVKALRNVGPLREVDALKDVRLSEDLDHLGVLAKFCQVTGSVAASLLLMSAMVTNS